MKPIDLDKSDTDAPIFAPDAFGLNDFQADLLVTDLIMPGMNGKELAEKIKEKLPGIRILFSSGYTDNHLVHNGKLDSEIDFLQKPYSAIDLLKKVRQVLQK